MSECPGCLRPGPELALDVELDEELEHVSITRDSHVVLRDNLWDFVALSVAKLSGDVFAGQDTSLPLALLCLSLVLHVHRRNHFHHQDILPAAASGVVVVSGIVAVVVDIAGVVSSVHTHGDADVVAATSSNSSSCSSSSSSIVTVSLSPAQCQREGDLSLIFHQICHGKCLCAHTTAAAAVTVAAGGATLFRQLLLQFPAPKPPPHHPLLTDDSQNADLPQLLPLLR